MVSQILNNITAYYKVKVNTRLLKFIILTKSNKITNLKPLLVQLQVMHKLEYIKNKLTCCKDSFLFI